MQIRVALALLVIAAVCGQALAEPSTSCEEPTESEAIPGPILGKTKLLPVFVDGEMAGVRFIELDGDSRLAKAGLQPGDQAVSVNGVPIVGPRTSIELLCRMRRNEPFTLVILRGGTKRLQITIPAAA